MNNEETRIINDEPIKTETPVNSTPKKKSSKGKVVAAAAGGFVAGAGVGVASSVMASNIIEETPKVENQEEHPAPEPEDVILANDEGIRFAHIEADNFDDAFNQAREQVGPGGAFEYNGEIYGTYYADEWNKMSNEERVEFQNRVNDVVPAHHTAHSHSMAAHNISGYNLDVETPNNHAPEPTLAHDAVMVAEEVPDNEIHILGVEAVQTEAGDIMNVALLEHAGDQALLVDVDNDGYMDVIIHDDDYNGQIESNEIHVIPGVGPHVNDILMAQAAQEGDFLAASDDGMPDYINDADSVMEI